MEFKMGILKRLGKSIPLAELMKEEEGGTIPAQCNNCVYRWPGAGRPSCDAFPGGIPPGVLANDPLHTRPLPELGQVNRLVHTPPSENVPTIGDMT